MTVIEESNNNDIENIDKKESVVDLRTWVPTDDQIYFAVEGDVVTARYDKYLGVEHKHFPMFVIKKQHFKKKIHFIVHHINYFLNYYDKDKELYMNIFSAKYLIDKNIKMTIKCFKSIIMERVVTDSLIEKIMRMTDDLYTLNINSDRDGKYKSTPKITNDQAKQIVAISFCIKLIFPLCVHFSNTNSNFVNKRDYIPCFNKIFMDIISRFETNGPAIYIPICRFIEFRVDKSYSVNLKIWMKKKQLMGITKETQLQELIHEIIIVKGLYKLKYWRSVVSFIDGILNKSFRTFHYENFVYKPVELSADDNSDNDDFLSRAEALEMSVYRIDESNMYINEVNTEWVLKQIDEKFNIEIPKEEFDFYMERCKINKITQWLLHCFYSRYFKNTNAVYTISDAETIKLLLYMKKFLLLKGMIILPQIATSIIKGKFKDNIIKNGKFIEKLESSTIFQNIIKEKFKYVMELSPDENLIIQNLCTIINSAFILVEYDSELDGMVYESNNHDRIIYEFSLFLSII